MSEHPRTRYATSRGADIAYQVTGDGPVDLLLFTGLSVPIDVMDEEPGLARFLRRLTAFGRLIRFDRQGIGLSDRGSVSDPPTPQRAAEDGLAVLDHLGSTGAVVIAPYQAAPEGVLLAALAPERVAGLILINGVPLFVNKDDYRFGLDLDNAPDFATMVEPDAVEHGVDVLSMLAPSAAGNAGFRDWWDRAGNLAATPSMARALLAQMGVTDVRDVLPQIQTRALVIGRTDNPMTWLGPGHSRYLAEHLPNAELVELPGPDILFWVGDNDAVLDEIEEFVTGVRGGAGVERSLCTMMFTDIVGSTVLAAELGDAVWRNRLELHDQIVRAQVARFRGRIVNTAGDGFLAIFDSPGRAIGCARSIRVALESAGLQVRTGIHTGEVEIRGEDVAGLAVHIGARIGGLAEAGEILVSAAIPLLTAGTGAAFVDRGEYELKGVPGRWHLFAAEG
ncbi:MAG: adenylate/guanylate cyclase domain-containing protein [Marmoricola sp.]